VKELVYHRQLLPAVERFGSQVGFVESGVERTFEQHLQRVNRLSSALGSEFGVSRSDRFAVMAMNSVSYLEMYHAAFLGAGVVNPLNLRLAPAEVEYILADSGTKVIFADGWFAEMIDQVRAKTSIEKVVLVGDADVPHDLKYEDLVAAGDDVVPDEPDEDDPVVLMYTGGTTGLPKGVLLDQRAEMLNLYHTSMLFRFDESYVYLHQTPLFHAASMGGVLGVPAVGARSVVIPSFNPEVVLDTIEAHGVTMTVMVPTMIGLTMVHDAYKPERLSSLRVLAYGASPMPQALLERIQRDLPDVDLYQAYGMTEASAVLTVLGPDEHRAGGERLRSAGRAVPGALLSVQDADGNLLPPGESGEVCARAGNFMREYWNKADATAEVFRDGWYHTGDAGYLDEDGYLFLVDRVKDMIVTGGENVYSSEVENAIATYPGVLQVAVIGIPDEVWGEAVHAVVVMGEGASATEDEIREHARGVIAGYKVPKSVEFRTEPLPLSGAMKVLKRELREPYWEGQGRSVN
jgi:long-chain acyl-CoA synthetase